MITPAKYSAAGRIGEEQLARTLKANGVDGVSAQDAYSFWYARAYEPGYYETTKTWSWMLTNSIYPMLQRSRLATFPILMPCTRIENKTIR
jgi:hypothetical protein